MNRSLETRLKKLEAIDRAPTAVVHTLLITEGDDADAMIAEKRASGLAKETDEFMVIELVALRADDQESQR